MAKKEIKTTKQKVAAFVSEGVGEQTPKSKPYGEKNYKGRSISMSDDFHEIVKDFAKNHPELGGISQMTVRALHEFMKRYEQK